LAAGGTARRRDQLTLKREGSHDGGKERLDGGKSWVRTREDLDHGFAKDAKGFAFSAALSAVLQT